MNISSVTDTESTVWRVQFVREEPVAQLCIRYCWEKVDVTTYDNWSAESTHDQLLIAQVYRNYQLPKYTEIITFAN